LGGGVGAVGEGRDGDGVVGVDGAGVAAREEDLRDGFGDVEDVGVDCGRC